MRLAHAKRCRSLALAVGALLGYAAGTHGSAAPSASPPFAGVWKHVGETSAVVYWRLPDIRRAALSYVEYGEGRRYGRRTPVTTEPRWAQLHRITGLAPGKTYHYRMVVVDAKTKRQTRSPDAFLKPVRLPGALHFPAEGTAPPYTLDRPGATYVLDRDVSAPGTAIRIAAPDVTLYLDGRTVTFATASDRQVFGIHIDSKGPATVLNGHVVQGAAGGSYSSAVESRYRRERTVVAGITTDVHRPNAYPLRFFGAASGVEVHHNHLYSRVTELESRHYPGNDLLRVDGAGPDIAIHDNLLTEGCHRGITLSGAGANIEVWNNDICHHMRYTNGYALNLSAAGARVHHNRVASLGRGAHLTAAGIEFADNFMELRGHMELDDMPQGSRPFHVRRIELHGIKLEGGEVRGCKVHGNFVRILQKLPDSAWDYVPGTPLNLACYDPNAMNEIYGNTFMALTEYHKTRVGGYGDTGQWAAPLFFVGMTSGPAARGRWSAYVHDNTFVSNDVFVASGEPVRLTVRVERNAFRLARTPEPTEGHRAFRGIGAALEASIRSGGNTFEGMPP